jgi:hypothetical protein
VSLEVGLVVVRPLSGGAFGRRTFCAWPVGDGTVSLDFVLVWAIRLVGHVLLLLFPGARCAVLINKTARVDGIFPGGLQIRKT